MAHLLSVIIISWNTRDLLRRCLKSVNSDQLSVNSQPSSLITDYRSLITEVIVIDNASTDGSAEMVARDFPNVTLIRNQVNLGFAKANNEGIRTCRGRYVLFLNSDTIVLPQTLPKLVGFMDEHADAGASGPRLMQPNGSVQPFAFGRDPTPAYLFARGISHLILHRPLHDWETQNAQSVDWVSGACMLARRAALEQVGGFDEKFFMYFEDNDLCLRLRRAGWKIFYNPTVTITHLGGASLAQNKTRAQLYDASLCYFYAKHYSLLARVALEIMLPFYRRIA